VEEAALRGAHAAGAGAGRADARRGAGLGARAGAHVARDAGRHLDLDALAGIGLFEGDFEVVAKVGAALASRAPAAAAAEIAEELVENVGEGGEAATAAAAAEAAARFEGAVAEAVVGGALLRVLQDLVGLVDLLELFGRAFAVAVGVELHGELAEGGLQLAVAAAPRNAEHLVIVTLGHALH
jgi:hypothetical protein